MTRYDFVLCVCVNGLAMGTDPIIDNRFYASLFIQEKENKERKRERKKCRERKKEMQERKKVKETKGRKKGIKVNKSDGVQQSLSSIQVEERASD